MNADVRLQVIYLRPIRMNAACVTNEHMQEKLDWVAPVDDRPSTVFLQHLVQRKEEEKNYKN